MGTYGPHAAGGRRRVSFQLAKEIPRKLGSFFGLGKQITENNQGNLGGGLGYETGSQHGFDGQGKTTRAGTLQGRLTCRVIEVMLNGNLRVWGYKQVRSNRETQYLVVEGLARPLDIQADNTIESSLRCLEHPNR